MPIYLFDLIQSFAKAKYLGSKMFKGKLVFGKKIMPLNGKTGIELGKFNFIIIKIIIEKRSKP